MTTGRAGTIIKLTAKVRRYAAPGACRIIPLGPAGPKGRRRKAAHVVFFTGPGRILSDGLSAPDPAGRPIICRQQGKTMASNPRDCQRGRTTFLWRISNGRIESEASRSQTPPPERRNAPPPAPGGGQIRHQARTAPGAPECKGGRFPGRAPE